MKKEPCALTLVPTGKDTPVPWQSTLSLLLPAALLLGGIWGSLGAVCGRSPAVPFLVSLLALLTTLWVGQSRRKALWSVLLLASALLLTLALFRPLQASLGALCNTCAPWFTQTTGVYFLPFTTDGSPWPAVIWLALLSGFLVGALVQGPRPLWLLLFFPLLLPAAGMLPTLWAPALYVLGMLLLLAKDASGTGAPLWRASCFLLVSAALAASVVLPLRPSTHRTEAGSQVLHALHQQVFESSKNPLPEGRLRYVPPYTPTHKATLEVTMEHWTPLYIRAFTGSDYTAEGWTPTDSQTAAHMAETLYVLQNDHFFPSTQPAAAFAAAGEACDNAVTIKNVGACRAYTYLPYGAAPADDAPLRSTQITGEGSRCPAAETLHCPLFPITDSYLLQSTLAAADAPAYRQAESVYRQWVYDTYLDLPEDARSALCHYIDPPAEPLGTTQARLEITQLLSQLLSYSEGTLTNAGDGDFVSYVLRSNPRGYSVHYATMATLLMRLCGIPARYVEGYVVSPAQAEAMPDGATLTLQQTNSHAWCEFYLDGVGWLPFDATPGYTDNLPYPLPPDGVPAGEENGTSHLQASQIQEQPEHHPLPVDQEPDREGRSHWIYVRQALSVLGVLLVLSILLLVARTLLRRRRLRQLAHRFSTADPRLAVGAILSYAARLLTLLGLPEKNLPLSQRQEEIARLLHGAEDLGSITTLTGEVWFSDHPITEAQRQQALDWLSTVVHIWQQDTPPLRRWQQRWLRCQVI